ncbi:MAG TPA: hypothetical protein VFX92_06375 [Candidatus Krumholzibacteria bacterium]|nr:hypothetical protein [Candidatus Krumholzibacteria bacterium]
METELYVYYGTNEYNFEKLENPPAFEPTHCAKCNVVISLGEDGYTMSGGEYWCERCAAVEFRRKHPGVDAPAADAPMNRAARRRAQRASRSKRR